jgi:putative salt-induced outer membrane protein
MNALALLTFSAINLGTAGYTLQPPEGTVTKDPVTTGSTDVGDQGKFAASTTEEDKNAEDATELEASVGGFLSTGNAEAASATALLKFRLRRGAHQFRAEAAANYGRAALPNDDGEIQAAEQTVGNVQGMLRYDWFFAKRWSAFLQATGRRDTFQDLDLRANIDPGVSFYALTDPKQRLWFEAGYDFQYDLRTQDAVDESVALDPNDEIEDIDRVFTNHAVRLFGGYVNNLNEHVTFDTGLEYLQSVIDAPVFRINWVTGLTANLNNRVSLSTSFTLRYENKPVAPNKLDTITAVLLGVRFI